MITQKISKAVFIIAIIGIFVSFTSNEILAGDSQDKVIINAVKTTSGGQFAIDISFTSSNQHDKDGKSYTGIGSFCIPLLYEEEIFAVDSLKFFNTITTWDEKFSNSIPDSGFISIAGIYDMGGKGNDPLYTGSDKSEHVATIYFQTNENAKPGEYAIKLTNDPRQGKPYFGSPDGVQSWLPEFMSGKIIIE